MMRTSGRYEQGRHEAAVAHETEGQVTRLEPRKFVVLGAGNRGNAYGGYLLQHAHEGRVVAVADPDPARLTDFATRHAIGLEGRFDSWETLLHARPDADAVIITTQDRMHTAPTLLALELGYDVLLEKPISPDPAECLAIADAAERAGRTVTVCHVLRYTTFFQELKQVLESGRIGRLLSVQWTENVGWYHIAHSFVRGNWRRTDESSPMILAKSCHDMDAIQWLIGQPCVRVSSFGSLSHFRPENAPAGATLRCTDGCPVEPDCPYSALKLYFKHPGKWPTSVVTLETSREGIWNALANGPYGRCVYQCDNDVVDHQVVNLEFAGGVTVSFTMTGFSHDNCRTMKFFGTQGEIRCHGGRNEIEVTDFLGRKELIHPAVVEGGHGGGDDGLMRTFISQLQGWSTTQNLSSARISANTHLLAFAAEESRVRGQTIDFEAFVQEVANRRS